MGRGRIRTIRRITGRRRPISAPALLATGLAFGTGYALGRWASGGNRWGGGFNWGGNNINVNRSVNVNNVSGNNWAHNPAHRGNVGYSNPGVAAKFGGNNARGGTQLNGRGSGGQQVLQPGGGNRSNLGGGSRRRRRRQSHDRQRAHGQ